MSSPNLVGFASIPVFGVIAQWIAWRFGLPSIVLLLLVGFLVGPLTDFLHPDLLLGDMLMPIVSLSVAIILFEGGLSLNTVDLKHIGKVVRNLVSVGAFVTWVVISIAARYILGLDVELAILLGSVLVVTGPTVISPMLMHIKPSRQVASVLRWEGIVIDPIGALMAVLVFEVILASGYSQAIGITFFLIFKTLIFGVLLGLWGALALMVIMKRGWLPAYLQESLTLVMVMGVFSMANVLQAESGLLSVTIMGIILANQKVIVIKHIITFKENLTILLLSSLFIILSARLSIDDLLLHFNLETLIFIAVLIFLARPLSVIFSTSNSTLTIKERLFITWMAPRGIVAAAIASLFAIRLQSQGFEQANDLVPITFLVILSTVILYGLTAPKLARMLGLVQTRYQGVLIAGASDFARLTARILLKLGISVLMVDTNRAHVLAAKSEGINAIQGNVLSEKTMEEVEISGIGRLLALTASDEVNLLAAVEFGNTFGRKSVFTLQPEDKSLAKKSAAGSEWESQKLFQRGMTHTYIDARITSGSTVKAIRLSDTYTFKDFKAEYPKAIPLFSLTKRGVLIVFSQDKSIHPGGGQTIIALV